MEKGIIIVLLAILVGIMMGISIILEKGLENLSKADCSDMISVYQHNLEAEIEKLKHPNTIQEMYNYGWDDALRNVSNSLKKK